MTNKEISSLTDELCRKAIQIAYPNELDEITYSNGLDDKKYNLDEFGFLYKQKAHSQGSTKLFVKPTHLIQAAKELFRGMPLAILKETSSWEEFQCMYKSMFRTSRTPDKGYGPETIQELEDCANILKDAENHLRNFSNSKTTTSVPFWEWRHYEFCDFCWRLVPQKKRQGKKWRCSIHADIHSPETRSARRLKNYVAPKYRKEIEQNLRTGQNMKNAFWIMLKTLKKETARFSSTQHCVDGNIARMVLSPPPSFDPLSIPKSEVDTELIWSFYPYAKKFAYEEGADTNYFYSAIKALDDDNDPTGMRDKIHQAYARAPILAESFLLNAEVWLRLESQKRFRGKSRN